MLRARKFLAGREDPRGFKSAAALDLARQQHAAMLAQPRVASLAAAWQPVGPLRIGSLDYGSVTGRITAIAIDPADATGNTVYVGTAGGGIWKSTNAAADPAEVIFAPLTDTLPIFSADSGSGTIASLSIGAIGIANGVILAGTGEANDALDSYYGTGILRSSDGGATWTLVQESHDGVNGNHSFVGLGFAAVAWGGASSPIAVAALSDAVEGALVNAPSATYSVRGLYYSNDAGVTWQMAVIQDATQGASQSGSRIVQSPESAGLNNGGNAATSVVWNPVRQRFYAAVRYHGYYESVDGMVWTRLSAQPGIGLTGTACPTNPGLLGSTSCPIFRGTLAVEPTSGDIFAFTVDAGLSDQGIWRDICARTGDTCASGPVAFSSQLNTTPLEGPNLIVAQGDYDLSLAAVASGSDTLVFAGTVDLYRCSLSSGCLFRNTTNTENGCAAPALVAPAQHAIAALGGANTLLYLGNDGGIWRSVDGVDQKQSACSADDASHFQNLNGGLGSLAEVVEFSQHPTDAQTVLVGVGANGTAATSDASANAAWPQLASGEGGFTAIDPVTPANRYISTGQGVSISYCGKGAMCAAADFSGLPTIGSAQVSQDDSLIDPPWLLDPALSSQVLIGTCRVWRGSADGTSWSSSNVLGPEFGGPQNPSCALDDSYIRSLSSGGAASGGGVAAPNAGTEVIYAGLAGILDGGGNFGGHIFATVAGETANASTAWPDLALSPVSNAASDAGIFNPGGFDISSIAVDPHDPTGATIYATIMGFANNGTDAPHIYRSTDAGANWTNVSSNLPNAPANGVVVDPNDANTVYVALDTGVYATSQIASCASENCWSIFGTGLPNAPVVQLSTGPSLPAGGNSTGLLRAGTYGRGIWEVPLLTAAPATSAQIAMTPASLSFTSEAVGTASSPQIITVTNSGTAPLAIGTITIGGDFHETDNCAGTSVAPVATCSVQVVFQATSIGDSTGLLTVYANVPGGQATAVLSGIGVEAAAVVLDPLSLDFGLVSVGQTAPAQSVTVSNTGGVTATLQSPTATGDFQISADTCQTSLAVGVGCNVTVVFSPTGTGTRNGTLTVADSAGTQLVSLTGRGASEPTDTLSPSSLSFGPQQAGSISAASTVTLTNSGDTALTLVAAQIASGAFTMVDGCGSSLNPHAACSLQVAFAPTSAGQQTGTLTVSDASRTQTVALSGTGLAPPMVQLSATELSFAATALGQTAAQQTIIITNSGDGQLTVASVTATNDFSETDNCVGVALYGSGRACSVVITFRPTAAGARMGVLTVAGTAAGQLGTASLSGTGLTPAALVLTPVELSFGTVTLGASGAAQNIAISNTGGVSTPLTEPAISGDFSISADTCSNTLAAFTGCTVAIVFKPTASGTRNGTISITDSAGTQTAALTGVGAASATDGLTPAALIFGPQQVGTSSATQPVTLTNTGDNTLTLIAVQVGGGNFAATNGCGASLAGHSSCSILVASTPGVNGPLTGVMIVSDQFRSQTVALSGVGVAPPGVGASPASLSFPGVAVGGNSTPQTVQISNSGTGELTVTSVAISGDFTESDVCAGKALTEPTTCPIQVTFSPTANGLRTGILTVFGSTPGSNIALQGKVSLTGTGDAPATIVLSPTSMVFGTVTLGSSSTPALNVTISNTGGVAASLQPPTVSGDFSISANTCGTTLLPSTGCTVAIVFTPTASGARSGLLSIADSAGIQTATLAGTGASSASDSLSPLSLTFAPQQVGTSSATQAVTLANDGDNPLTLIAVQMTGGGFTALSGCGASLAGHSVCTIAVASKPETVGATAGVLTISDQFRAQTVALSGSGLAAPGVSLTPASGLIFAATGVAQTSAAQTITLSNKGGSSLSISGISVTGDFTLPNSLSNCGTTLAAGAACAIAVVFAPTAPGTRSGSVSVTDNSAGSPQAVALQGTGVDFTLNANGATRATVSSGQSAVFPLLLGSLAGTPGTVDLSCTGAPVNSICTVVPSVVPLGGTATISATVETGVTVAAFLRAPGESSSIAWWATIWPLGILFFGRWRRRPKALLPQTLFASALALLLLGTIGCGAGRTIPGSTSVDPVQASPLTPSGTYTVTISATSAGLTRSVAVTLVVQ